MTRAMIITRWQERATTDDRRSRGKRGGNTEEVLNNLNKHPIILYQWCIYKPS